MNLVHGSDIQFNLVHGCDEEGNYLRDQLARVTLLKNYRKLIFTYNSVRRRYGTELWTALYL
jgi:hypothetical protein